VIGNKAARAACVLLAGVLNGWPWLDGVGREARFVTAPPARASSEAPIFREEVVDPESPHPMAHVASMCELGDGRLAAVWYAGSREGASDVAIYFSTRASREADWTPPRAIVSRESASRDLRRFVKKVGNAVVFTDEADTLWLVYVTVAVGGWSGSSLNVTLSHDAGATWTPSVRLTLSPFFNVAELVKNGPVTLSDGSWALPIYHEFIARMGEVLWLREGDRGIHATKSRITWGRSMYQPSLVPLDGARALAVLRAAGPARHVSLAQSLDGGHSWAGLPPTDLPNPDSGLDALRLTDGRLLLAFNDSSAGRDNLRLAMSSDEGQTWRRVATLASEAGADFSYPFLLQTSDKLVHVVYSWQRRSIKHVVFNTGWVDARLRDGTQ